MLWEFYKYEDKHGEKSTAFDVQMNGGNRHFIFCNEPKKQRICNCHKCKTRIPREVPRIYLDGAYYYGSGYYCLSCGTKILQEKKADYEGTMDILKKEVANLDNLMAISATVMTDEQYPKRMALGRMLQVMGKEGGKEDE